MRGWGNFTAVSVADFESPLRPASHVQTITFCREPWPVNIVLPLLKVAPMPRAEAWHGLSAVGRRPRLAKRYWRVDWTHLSTQSGISEHINPWLHRSPHLLHRSFILLPYPSNRLLSIVPFFSHWLPTFLLPDQTSFTCPLCSQDGICLIVTGRHLSSCSFPIYPTGEIKHISQKKSDRTFS